MPVRDTGPLDWRIAITDQGGRPTPEFQRRWNTQRDNNDLITSIVFGEGAPTGIPNDGEEYVDISVEPFVLYVGNGGTWHQVGVRVFTDLADVPDIYTADNLVQVSSDGTELQFTPLEDLTDDPSATASDVAVDGTASTFMRSDAAPAIQKATSSQFGIVQVDGTTITEVGGVISSSGGGGGGTGGMLPLTTGESPVALIDDTLGQTIGVPQDTESPTRIIYYFTVGVSGDFPMSPNLPPNTTALYYATDLNVLHVWNSTNWEPVA